MLYGNNYKESKEGKGNEQETREDGTRLCNNLINQSNNCLKIPYPHPGLNSPSQ